MFGLNFNYGFKQLLNIGFIKNKLTDILQILFANLLELQTCSILSYLCVTNTPIDYLTPIVLSTVLSINIPIFYRLIEPFRPQIYWLARYLIKYYSIENYFLWKKIIVSNAISYGIIYLYLIPVNNRMIIIYLCQSLISFLIIDQYEQRVFHRIWNYYYFRPKTTIYHPIPNQLINSYLPTIHEELIGNDLPKIVWNPKISDSNKTYNELDNSFIVIKHQSCRF